MSSIVFEIQSTIDMSHSNSVCYTCSISVLTVFLSINLLKKWCLEKDWLCVSSFLQLSKPLPCVVDRLCLLSSCGFESLDLLFRREILLDHESRIMFWLSHWSEDKERTIRFLCHDQWSLVLIPTRIFPCTVFPQVMSLLLKSLWITWWLEIPSFISFPFHFDWVGKDY